MNHSIAIVELNIAPQAPRHRPLAWVILFISIAIFCVSLFPLATLIQEIETLSKRKQELQAIASKMVDEKRKVQLSGDSAGTLRRKETNQAFQALTQLSWESFFDVLETAADLVHGGTSIVSMSPKNITSELLAVDLTGVALNMPIMLAYFQALHTDSRLHKVELNSQQPDKKTAPEAIRFQMTLYIDPRRTSPRSSSTSASPAAQITEGTIASIAKQKVRNK